MAASKSGKSGRTYHHGDLKDTLLRVAQQMLERDGPEAISFRALARAAGVSATAPYNHFESREALLASVAQAGFHALAATQRDAMQAGATGEERLVGIGLDYLRFATGHPQLYRLMFGVGVSNWRGHPAVIEAKGESFRPIRTALAEHLSGAGGAGDPGVRAQTASLAAWALVHGMAMLLIDGSIDLAQTANESPDALQAAVVRLFICGLRRD